MKAKQRYDEGRGTSAKTRRGGRMRGLVAGVAVASAFALGGAFLTPVPEAKAAPSAQELWDAVTGVGDVLDALGSLNTNAATLVNGTFNSVMVPVLGMLNSDACAPGYEGGVNGNANCSLTWGDGTGAAIVLTDPAALGSPALLAGHLLNQLIPGLDRPGLPANSGTAMIIGDGKYLAMAMNGGKAYAIALTPLSFANATANGGTSVAFALVGVANAMNTPPIGLQPTTAADVAGLVFGNNPNIIEQGIIQSFYLLAGGSGAQILPGLPLIPAIQRVDCLGVVAAAYNDKAGACLNLGATVDAQAKWKDGGIPELQLGLLNPLALLTDPGDVLGDALSGVLAGGDLPPLQNLLTQDFGRLTVGGNREGSYGLPNLIAFTSDYGLKEPITINWMGQKVTIFPKFTQGSINGNSDHVNYLGIPQVTLGSVNTDQFLPGVTGLSFDNIAFPGSDILGLLGGLFGGGGAGILNTLGSSLGLGGVLPLSNVDSNVVQKLGTQTLLSQNLGANTAAAAPMLASYGLDGQDATKIAAAAKPDTSAARSASASLAAKTRETAKKWQSATQRPTQNAATQAQSAVKPQATTEAWKARREQRQQNWQQQKQTWQEKRESWQSGNTAPPWRQHKSTPDAAGTGSAPASPAPQRFGNNFRFGGNSGGQSATTPGSAATGSPAPAGTPAASGGAGS